VIDVLVLAGRIAPELTAAPAPDLRRLHTDPAGHPPSATPTTSPPNDTSHAVHLTTPTGHTHQPPHHRTT
jgi:hypothetical protein